MTGPGTSSWMDVIDPTTLVYVPGIDFPFNECHSVSCTDFFHGFYFASRLFSGTHKWHPWIPGLLFSFPSFTGRALFLGLIYMEYYGEGIMFL